MTLRGVDVSNHQGEVDWPQVAGAGFAFAFMKASEGVTFTDPFFAQNWERSRKQGLTRGSYHFARPNWNAPEAEAAKFVSVVANAGGLLPGDMVCLDMEDDGVAPGGMDLADWSLRWLRAVEMVLGVRPVFYSGRWYLEPRGLWNNGELGAYPWWLAAYGEEAPPFARFWQHSSTGAVPGVQGNCDLNIFFGDAAALRALGMQDSQPDPARDWQTAIDVTRGWSRQLAQASKELADVAGILERLRPL